jgi:hypothetical protein
MLALLTMNPARIGVAPLADLSDMRRFDIVNIPVLIGFSPTGDALTYLESRKGAPALWTQPLAGGDPKPLLDLKGDRIFSFAYARDGRLAVAHGPAPSDVVLMAGIK